MTILIHNAAQVVCVAVHGELVKRGSAMRDVVVYPNASVLVEEERISWVGPARSLPTTPADVEIIDAAGKTVVPGLVDSHTHLVFAGSREEEFEQRLTGVSYQEIAARGGGINATVAKVRQASRDLLKQQTRRRLERFLRFGVTTVEVKSGYGLRLADELKCLEVIADLNSEGPTELVPTFLGAHSVPPECQREEYIRLLIEEMLPEIARSGLAEFCDVFCETGVFDINESERILSRAQQLGLGLKLHADELSTLGGAELAARVGAISADHLLRVSEQGMARLAEAGTIATLLPGTAFFLGLAYAPARRLIAGGVPVALATDCNPGTCPTENLPLMGTLACTQMSMQPGEVLSAMTLNGAAAVGRSARLGSIVAGKQADLVICDVPSYQHIFYHFGVSHVWRVIKRGRVVFTA